MVLGIYSMEVVDWINEKVSLEPFRKRKRCWRNELGARPPEQVSVREKKEQLCEGNVVYDVKRPCSRDKHSASATTTVQSVKGGLNRGEGCERVLAPEAR